MQLYELHPLHASAKGIQLSQDPIFLTMGAWGRRKTFVRCRHMAPKQQGVGRRA